MRLFRRTNSIRRTLDAQHAVQPTAAIGDELDLEAATVPPEVTEAHRELDSIESKLALLKQRQQALVDRRSTKKGSVQQLDLRALIDLADDEDEDFNERFETFASSDIGDNDRRWMENS